LSAAIATHRAEQVADETKATDAGQRYAQSLFELTIESNQLTQVEADLKSLRTMAAESADLRRLIESPAFSAEDKAKGLTAVAAKAQFQLLTAKFLGLVASNGRAGDLLGAITAFIELSAVHRGVVTAEVTTA
jgi:F-type H+-transporting ATPase subunit delta